MTGRHRHVRTGVALLVAATVAMTGCASTSDEDSADSTAATSPRAPVMIAAAPGDLDHGSFIATPNYDYPETAGDPEVGSIIESQRMTEFLVLPAEIDPSLSEGQLDFTRPIFGPFPLAFLLAGTDENIEQIGEDTGMYAGFSTARYTEDRDGRMIHAVLQFRDATSASEAAIRLHRYLLQSTPASGLDLATMIPVDHPLTTMPGSLVSVATDDENMSATAFTPHGRYIIYTFVHGPADRMDWAERSIARALELQRPMIDRFPYTEPARLGDLEVDIDKLLHRTLQYPPDEEGGAMPAVYGPRGAAHLMNQLETLDMFEDTFATHMARDGSFVYSTDYDDRAQALFDRLVGQMRNKNADIISTTAAGPPGVPDARCFDVITDLGTFATCALLHGRFVAEIRASSLSAAHRATTAQYMIFEAADAE